ncbi:hypothetical protein L195_g055702, partial [Trifolium pratense]
RNRLDLEPAPTCLAPDQYGCTDEVAGMVTVQLSRDRNSTA